MYVVKEGPAGSLAMGMPAKVIRQLTPEEIEGIRENGQKYLKLKEKK